jgi:ribosomal protein S3
MQSRKQQKNKNYLRSKQYAEACLLSQGWKEEWLKLLPEIGNAKVVIMTANRTIRGKTTTITKTIIMGKGKTNIERLNNAMMEIVENAGSPKAPLTVARVKTNAAGKVINAARVQLNWNDRSGSNTKPELLK